MTPPDPRRSRETCSQFADGLVERIDGMDSTAARRAARHAESCPTCSDRLAAGRRNVELLASLEPLVAPEAMGSAAFVAGIHERATAAAESSGIGDVLRENLTPLRAPGDVIWREVTDRPELEPHLRALMPAGKTPGWMWRTVRATVVGTSSPGEGRRPRSVARRAGWLAAAAIVCGALLIRTGDDRTHLPEQPSITVVWDSDHGPTGPLFSPYSTLADLGR